MNLWYGSYSVFYTKPAYKIADEMQLHLNSA